MDYILAGCAVAGAATLLTLFLLLLHVNKKMTAVTIAISYLARREKLRERRETVELERMEKEREKTRQSHHPTKTGKG